ncbi:N-6 DNA methylase [Pseudoalteromonas aurantia]|uniref:DNA methylase adenine-specific domain-containing protein n=1 Tax=Pseudoalteromonas aurantia TaxID=43654 RepID=A0ABY2VUL9_9GAMM|nr:N-6 DNA methylase [Pseudoalteromonas aurantia]TMO72011.1 hypothetical protein CWC20_16090 [Pseudoalteromonas aurantia]
MNKKNILGQFYTPDCISEKMISKVLCLFPHPQKVLELAAGEGHLLNALCSRAKLSHITAIDVDSENVDKLQCLNPEWDVIHADAMTDLPSLSKGTYDIALGNPPFLGNVVVDSHIHELFKKVIGYDARMGSKTRAEYIFICQYIELLSEGGLLAIIVPDTLISGFYSAMFRERLIESVDIVEVGEITSSAFTSTEAKTHVLYLKKQSPTKASIVLTSDRHGTKSIAISNAEARSRMDFASYINKDTDGLKQHRLSECADVSRGKYTHKELKSLECKYIHSTTFNYDHDIESNLSGERHLLKGDIIMCRVGSRVVGKNREYRGSPILYSDCIYRIRFRDAVLKEKFLKFLFSDKGSSTISSLTRGVCSRYITKSDLENILFV